ncbi:MAG: hypothetical protein AAFR33_06670 [Pseudomonadota bacterium]
MTETSSALSSGNASTLEMRLLGSFGLFVTNGEELVPVALKSRKGEAILLCLAIEPEGKVRRTTLKTMLWPDSSDSRASASLRTALTTIRRHLGDVIEQPEHDWLSLNRARVICDYWRLMADPVEATQTASPVLLADAPAPTKEFQEWLRFSEVRMRNAITGRLTELIEEPGGLSPSDLKRLCALLMGLEPLDEALCITVVNALCKHDAKNEAKRLADTYRARLREDVDVEPSNAFYQCLKENFAVEPSTGASPRRQPEKVEGPRIVVSPLRSLSNDSDVSYFGSAVAEDLLGRLSRQTMFQVFAADLLGTYKPPGVQFGQADHPEGYHVAGSYMLSNDRVRMTLQLTSEAGGNVVWTDRFDEPITNLFDVQTKIVDRIASCVPNEVLSAESEAAQLDQRSPDELDEWTRIMKARYLFWRTSRENNREARSLLAKGISQPRLLVAGLTTSAFVRLLDVWSFWSEEPEEDLAEAHTLAQRAVREQPHDPWGSFTLATVMGARGNPEQALAHMDRALQLDPNFVAAIGEHGRLNAFMGDFAQARKHSLDAIELNTQDPHYSLWANTIGLCDLLEGEAEGALAWANRAIMANPYWYHHHLLQAAAFTALGRPKDARKAFDIAKSMIPGLSRERFHYSHPLQDEAHRRGYYDLLEPNGF